MSTPPITPLEVELLQRLAANRVPVSLLKLFEGLVPDWVASPLAALQLRGLVEQLRTGNYKVLPEGEVQLANLLQPEFSEVA